MGERGKDESLVRLKALYLEEVIVRNLFVFLLTEGKNDVASSRDI